MTTVIDPAGTPVPVFNRSGLTIVEVTATGNSPGAAAVIPAVSGHTIAMVTTATDEVAVALPSGAEIGDLVEIYCVAGPGASVYAPSGETLPGAAFGVNLGLGSAFRKTSSTVWRALRQP